MKMRVALFIIAVAVMAAFGLCTQARAEAPYCWVYQESDLPFGSNEAGSEFCKFADGAVFNQMCGEHFTVGQDTRACVDPDHILSKGHIHP